MTQPFNPKRDLSPADFATFSAQCRQDYEASKRHLKAAERQLAEAESSVIAWKRHVQRDIERMKRYGVDYT